MTLQIDKLNFIITTRLIVDLQKYYSFCLIRGHFDMNYTGYCDCTIDPYPKAYYQFYISILSPIFVDHHAT